MSFTTFIILLVGEFLLNYSQESTIGLALSGLSDELNFIPLFTRYLISIIFLIGSIIGILIGLLTDIFMNKIIIIIIFSHVLTCFTMILSLLITLKSYLIIILMNILICSISLYAMVGGIRYSFLAEQIPFVNLSEVQKYIMLIIFCKFLGSFAFELFSLFINEKTFYLLNSIIMCILNTFYTFILIILTPSLQTNTRYSITSIISEYKTKDDFFDIVSNFCKSRRWLKILILLSLYTSYGFISFILPEVYQKQFDNIAYETNTKPVKYKLMHSYLTLILLIMIELIICPYLKKYHYLQFICASMIVISVPIGMASMAQNLCQSHNLPNDNSLLMIYNGLEYNLTIQSELFIKTIIYKNKYHVFLIESNVESALVNYTYENQTFQYVFDIYQSQSVSYIIKNEIVRLEGYDPLYYGPPGFNKPGYPIVFIVPINPKMDEIIFSNKFKTKIFNDQRIFISIPPDTYNIKNEKMNKNFNFKYGGIYSIIIYDNYINVHNFVQPCNYGFYIILIYICSIGHSLAHGIGLVSLYKFLYFEISFKYRNMFFSYSYLAQTIGHGAHLWTKRWYLEFNFYGLVTYFTTHLLFTMIFILASTLYKSKKVNY